MYWALILFFIPKLSCLQALRIQNESKENFWAFFCMLPSKLRGKANETGEMGNHCPPNLQGHRLTKPLSGEAAAAGGNAL